jgi:uncharacterized integral membrane protein
LSRLPLFLTLPITLAAILFSLMNRASVDIVWFPAAGSDPGRVLTLPLFAVVLGSFVTGFLFCGLVAWISQRPARGRARQDRKRVARLERELAETPAAAPPPAPRLAAPGRDAA